MPSYLNKKTINDLDLSSYKRAVVRLDLNVPVANGVIGDEHRITASLQTLRKLLDAGLKVVVLSHLSRIKSLDDINSGKKSLKIVSDCLGKKLPDKKVVFVASTDFDLVRKTIENGHDADVFVLQNTRYYDVDASGEVVKWESKNNPELAKFWASLGDVFVNDAFGTSHRAHASNVGVAKLLPSAMGYLVEKEIISLSKAFDPSKSEVPPLTFVMGGSKVSDKLKLIQFIAPKADKLIIGGGMSYTFLKAMGKEVGNSLVEQEMIGECKTLLDSYGSKLFLPVDHVVAPEFKDVPGTLKDADDKDWNGAMALDIGPKSIAKFMEIIQNSKTVVWNGPMGVFEFGNFEAGTKAVAEKMAEVTKTGAYTVVGGGDSASAMKKFGLTESVSFVSTGGGASLAFFEGSPMPGIEAISDK